MKTTLPSATIPRTIPITAPTSVLLELLVFDATLGRTTAAAAALSLVISAVVVADCSLEVVVYEAVVLDWLGYADVLTEEGGRNVVLKL